MPKFSPLVSALTPPPIPGVAAWGRMYEGGRGPLIDLSQAAPGYPPHDDLLGWLAETAGAPRFAGYGPIEGEPILRKAYAEHVAALYDAPIANRNIHITAGCNQAFVATILALVAPGQTVLLTNPHYFNHETSLTMLGIETDLVPCDAAAGFLPDVEAVAAALHPDVRALALVSPNNPTGSVYPPELLEAIDTLCRTRGIWLILDETYRDFLPDTRPPHRLFARENWQNHVVSLYSFSKSYCIPGHRLGAITGGVQLIQQVAKIMDNLQICAPRPAQVAVAKAIPALAGWREQNRLEIVGRADALRAALSGLEDWDIKAIGAYFAYVRHPYPDISAEFVAGKLASLAGVVSIPGEYFGEAQEPYLRFAFANADQATIAQLTDRLGGFELPGI
ncbi:aminotransferase [Rhizobium sp. YIM 134829]|uniref:aminotransferase n=1 Tax=Rhizobium sp. YIM 134829 TaxID=3390453 RepID=UPI0039786AAB